VKIILFMGSNMKKIVISFIFIFIISSAVFAADGTQKPLLKSAISDYKQGNLVGCLQLLAQVLEQDPSDALARYYLAITFVKTGQFELAKKEYSNVIDLNASPRLTSYAQTGLKCINEPDKCPSSSATIPSPPKVVTTVKSAPDKVKTFIDQKKLDNVKEIINSGQTINGNKMQNFEDFSKKKSAKPTNEEIVKALETLKDAGLSGYANPYQSNPYQNNAEMMQMNMLTSSMGGMNNNNNNNSMGMNMLPLLMMQQQNGDGKTNIDPKVLQSIMMTSMMPNLNGFDSNNN
jgi:tetratricopeptide (TPR) repeat protein